MDSFLDEMNGSMPAGDPSGEVVPTKSFAETVLERAAAARDDVQRAITVYETQRSDILADATARAAEIDGHLTALRAALGPAIVAAPEPVAEPSVPTRRNRWDGHRGVWDRVEAYLREHGPARHTDIAKALRTHQANVLTALRSHSDRAAIFTDDAGRQSARLK